LLIHNVGNDQVAVLFVAAAARLSYTPILCYRRHHQLPVLIVAEATRQPVHQNSDRFL
jgi:hypothetical protein